MACPFSYHIKHEGDIKEDGGTGSPRNPCPLPDETCAGRICLVELSWNSGAFRGLERPGKGSAGKLCLVLINFSS